MEDMNQNNDNKECAAANNVALYFVALFVVAIMPFLLHFNLLYAPMQGDEFEMFLFDKVMHSPGTALSSAERFPGSSLGAFTIGFLWQLGGGGMFMLRCAALLALVLTAILVFYAIRVWLNYSESVIVPLLCALLFAISPAPVGVIASAPAWPAALGLAWAGACIVLFLNATREAERIDWLQLVLSCCALVLAASAHHSLLLLPVALFIIDLLRKAEEDALRLSPVWRAHAATAGAALATAVTIRYAGGALEFSTSPALLYFASFDMVFILAWLLAAAPVALLRRGLLVALMLVLPLGGATAFRQALRCVDPVPRLEQQAAASDDSALYNQIALHYIEAARRESEPETQAALLKEAQVLLEQNIPATSRAAATRRVLGEQFLATGNYEKAALLLEPFLVNDPYGAGRNAAIAQARSVNERERAKDVADLYAFALGVGDLPQEDKARYGKTLMLLGDTVGAATLLAALPDLDEKSEAAMYRKQALAAYNAAATLLTTAREKMTEDPKDPAGYIASAEREMITGNNIRAFYWLELAMRREPENEQAWELLGVLFARHQQEALFLEQWGGLKEQGHKAWLGLARQSAMFQAWDAAFAYAQRYVGADTPSAEEFMAAFAMEARRIALAREWFERATEARPESYTPWLALADIAAAMQQPAEARQYLLEAENRHAPADEIAKRRDNMGNETATPDTRPFEPVRTYIQ